MKFFIKIMNSSWFSETEMKYKDDKGKCFIGKPINYVNGEITIIEASDTPSECGCHHIIKFIEMYL